MDVENSSEAGLLIQAVELQHEVSHRAGEIRRRKGEREREREREREEVPLLFFLVTSLWVVSTIWTPGTG